MPRQVTSNQAQLGTLRDVFAAPSHPYTEALLRAMPQNAARTLGLVIGRHIDGGLHEDIATELDVSMANLYAIRSRAVKDLRKLKDRYES